MSGLKELDTQIDELRAGLRRVDKYLATAEEVLDRREGVATRLEGRANCRRLLREIGELTSSEAAGFEMRRERLETVLAPFRDAQEPLECDDAGSSTVADLLANDGTAF